MPTATIEVKRNFRPETSKFNKNFGTVVTPDGTKYGYHKNMASQFQDGGVYEIFFETNEKGYHDIKTAKPSSVTAGAAGTVLSQATQARAPSPSSGGGPDPHAENIFVAGAVNHAIGAGQFDVNLSSVREMATIIFKLREAYRLGSMTKQQTNGAVEPAQTGQQHDPEMEDRIPF